MHKFLMILISLISGVSVFAQTSVIGIIFDSKENPIAGANVMLKSEADKMLTFCTTDSAGHFSLSSDRMPANPIIQVSMIGYKPYKKSVILDGLPLRIILEEGALQLKEVIVKADRIRENGDTIKYSVGSFAQKQDRTIGDVLKRMPGIDVANNGKIQYQGVDINKFYIEGNDLLGGKYGIATNGISHDDIGTVEVMENHQPMQVLRGLSFSDQAAINLKMKNSAKASFLVHGTLSGGYSQRPEGFSYQGDIFTMMVTGRYQMITTLKGNNTGASLTDQLTDYTSERPDENMAGYLSLSTPVTPNLKRDRSWFNQSWMVSSSHLFKNAKGSETKVQVDYENDRVTSDGVNKTTYFLDSGDKIILEDKHSLSRRNALTGKLAHEVNQKNYYLNNILSTDLSWNNLAMNMSGTLNNTQEARMPDYSVTNLLKVIKRFGQNRLVTFTSRNEWNSLPEQLTVSTGERVYGQNISQYSFFTDERASMGFVFNRILLSLEAGASGYLRNLDTDLYGMDLTGIVASESLTTNYIRLFASPKFEWSYRKLELTFNMPVNLYTYFFSGAMQNRSEFLFSPSIAAKFKITSRMSLTLRGNAGRSPASLHGIHDSSILTDFRTFSSGVNDYYTASGQSLSASCMYRNASRGIFITAMGRYGWNHSKYETVQNVIGDYIFHSYRAQPSDSRNALGFLQFNKALDFVRGACGIRGNYIRTENNLISQGRQTSYTNDMYSVSPFINGNISRFCNWNIKLTWDKSIMQIASMNSRSSDNLIYSAGLTLTPCSLITWTTGGEYYHNQIAAERYKEMFMLDTKLTFNISKRFEIAASATNLLNNQDYNYTTYGTLSQYERSSRLRGREFLISIYLKK